MNNVHTIFPARKNLHGSFSRDYESILQIHSGESVRFQTLDAGWGLEPLVSLAEKRKKFEPREMPRDQGHALCGPVYIHEALPGKTLEIRINDIVPGKWGWSTAGGYPHSVNEGLGLAGGEEFLLSWGLDSTHMTGKSQFGHEVPLKPFMGIMGMPPNEEGIHSTTPPRFCGGNIDCKELVSGTTLYLPISVEGALFSVGDGHGVQGDGEVGVSALECPMERVDLTFIVRDDLKLKMPSAETQTEWISFGFHEGLDEAMIIALDGMLDIMQSEYGLKRKEALTLASLGVDMRITQVVNGVKGVHAMLNKKFIKR
ncbi:acetamidase/formamidase family protein [Fictibacillus sp. KU28468]|uniref:acetamidase/formamidase family protein n=1 Tax=Fictibacillus sp. KU28468 TaxID=2991053 RepID=UPI00223E8782|nr:acetamidase/formamidase family protein [Fictibacillus sp. KU28468]UZJ80164.1 acetamidase/formamidase family protein [Fictibacillus sp. KU28468]